MQTPKSTTPRKFRVSIELETWIEADSPERADEIAALMADDFKKQGWKNVEFDVFTR